MRFSFTASFPNVFDAQDQIQRPAEKFNKAVGGDKTTVEVVGPDLDEEILVDLARGAAATGEKASATVRQPGKRNKRISLSGSPVQELVDQNTSSSIYINLLTAAVRAYERVRAHLT